MHKLKIAVYAICKNEEHFVDRWLNSMQEADMVIVADTGSTDGTVEKLRARDAIVYNIKIDPWRFDVARNISLNFVPGDVDVCICTDLDEVLEPGWREKLEKVWTPQTTRLKYMYTWSFNPDGSRGVTFWYEKIHRRHGFRWVHPVHEVLAYYGSDPDCHAWEAAIQLNHYPDPGKSRGQYLPLLEMSVREDPDDDRNMHYLGREYMFYRLWDKCIETLQKHLAMPRAQWKDERCASMRFIARAYKAKGDCREARNWLYRAMAEAPHLREPYVELAQLAYGERDWPTVYCMAEQALKIKERTTCYMNEPFAWDATVYDLGALACYELGMFDKSYAWIKIAVEMSPTDERLKNNLQIIKSRISPGQYTGQNLSACGREEEDITGAPPPSAGSTADQPAVEQGLTSIIIVTYNKLDYTRLCIESIRQYTKPDAYEIIVIDNHSTDGTVEWLQGQQDIRLILNEENAGFPAGCNQGIKAAPGNSVLLLNNDTVVTPGWLRNLKKCLFSSNDIGAVGAVTSCAYFQNIPCEYSSMEEMIRFAREVNHSNPELWENRSRLVGFCMLIKTEAIRKIGLLDETFSPGNYEDDDYCLRLRRAGYRLMLCRDTFIHHFGNVSFGEPNVQYKNLLAANRQKFIDKWGLDPHCLATPAPTPDLALKKWFVYQYEFNHYRQLLQNTRTKFFSFIDQAEFAFLSGHNEKAALVVKQAADFAYHSHPGCFVSPRLELILRKVGQKLNDPAAIPIDIPEKNVDKRNILHVLSQGYPVGSGHTRLLERWINMDLESAHSILVTLNSSTTPQWLIEAAVRSGGWYHTLDASTLSLCQKAKVLRDVAAAWADMVVLHIHPHDPIPSMAFGTADGPPVIFSNHADHAFTLGVSAADIVAEYRAGGKAITLARRNVNESHVLPLPLGGPLDLPDKQISKKVLGIQEDSIVFLTIASPHQLVACGEYNYINLIREIAKRQPHSAILVVGPSESGEWLQLKRESDGRIRSFGCRQDLNLFYSAADIYLDSMPLGSFSEAFEAGTAGIPVVGLATAVATHLSTDIAPGIVKTHFSSTEELFTVIDRLVGDEAYRLEQGNSLQATILQNHYLGWTEHLYTLYSLLPLCHKPSEILDVKEQPAENSDVIWAFFQHKCGLSHSRFG